MEKVSFIVKNVGRLDKVLTENIDHSRNQVEKLIKEGLVSVNGKVITKRAYQVSLNDRVEYSFKEAIAQKSVKVNFEIDIIYEDSDIMVINKPSGVVVHPAQFVKGATVVDWLKKRGISLSTISGEERHGIVHRIDKDTTGALVIAKNNKAHQILADQLRDKSMGRYYLALIDYPLKESGFVEKPIGRSRKSRYKMDIMSGGKVAKSAFYKIAQGKDNIELIAAKLFTGRTHQIRVHLNSLGRHILGDVLYGFKSKKDTIKRVLLHAYKLYLIHPSTGKRVEFIAPLFPDMEEFICRKFNQGEIDEKIDPNIIDSYFHTIINRL
jgi:23S rRNA pseudouridine1911/1915/1917 synthase